jgi:hypothetical protein
MANPNISLLGATYNSVSGVQLPTSGGGTATFPFVEGSQTITQNGTVDVTNLAEVIVNVSGGGGSGLTYETGTYTPSADIAQPTINFANAHTELPIFVMMSDAMHDYNTTTYTSYFWSYQNFYTAFGSGVPYSSSAERYGLVTWIHRTNGSSNTSNGAIQISYTTGNSNTSYLGYWLSTSWFKPSSNSTSRYWRKNRTYKWIAIWKPTS